MLPLGRQVLDPVEGQQLGGRAAQHRQKPAHVAHQAGAFDFLFGLLSFVGSIHDDRLLDGASLGVGEKKAPAWCSEYTFGPIKTLTGGKTLTRGKTLASGKTLARPRLMRIPIESGSFRFNPTCKAAQQSGCE
ncbi:hypothetical protein GCM10010914_12910 [Deinococcus wulumuqiensis]|uniref:Uncharacterized protein n=1 Tax=Deinococcus wulumuqiensis TaxID=980427 RepID=A0AAV4K300_9DEIO|nr:hypothetical protein GCM10010914_12910 [Deinococcus wulumuqiensis]